jgi:hypothetical protein
VDTVGSIARAYTSLAFRQSQAVLEKFPSVQSCTSVSVIGVGSTLLWLQEEVAPTPFSMDAVKSQLLAVERADDLRDLAKRFKRKKGQSEREYQEALHEYARRREAKRREKMANVRARSVDNRAPRGSSSRDVMALLDDRHEQRHARTGKPSSSSYQRSNSQTRLNRSSLW